MGKIYTLGKIALAALLVGAAFAPANAATLTLQGNGTDPNAAILSAGNTFTVSLLLNTSVSGEQAVGVSYFLETLDTGSSLFQIVGRNIAASPFTSLTTDDGTALAAANALLDPRNDNDLGGLTADGTPVGPGSYTIAQLTIQAVAGTKVGAYTLQIAPGAILTDENFNDVTLPSATFGINVTAPEPATLAFLAASPFALLLRRRRPA